MENSSPLVIQGWKSCQVILHLTTGLCLCNRAECPVYKNIRCNTCDYRVLFHNNTDRKVVKIALSMMGLMYQHPKDNSSVRHVSKIINDVLNRITRRQSLERRVDLGTRTFMYKILIHLADKYQKGEMVVETNAGTFEFADCVDELARQFLDVDPKDIGFKRRFIKLDTDY